MSYMTPISTALVSYDVLRVIKNTLSPGSDDQSELLSSLSRNDKETLQKISKMVNSLCTSAGLDSSNVSIRLNQEGSVTCQGTSSKTVIHIGMDVLMGISSKNDSSSTYFLQAYHEKLSKFPDSPESIKKAVKSQADQSLNEYLGLHDRCQWMLSDKEIRFILAHELKGHAANDDNIVLLASFLTISVTTFLALNILLPDCPIAQILLFSWMLAKVANLPISRTIERSADYSAIKGDEEAAKGAQRYFKKHLIAEMVKKELDKRQKGQRSLASSFVEAIDGVRQLKSPSTSVRFQQVLHQ